MSHMNFSMCMRVHSLSRDYKSLAYKIVFRAKDHTLKDDEVNAAMDKIIKALAEMDVELRQ